MDCRTAQQKIMPYIQRTLPDEEMEEFLDHVDGCRECAEELEVYFTICYALQKLDQDDTESLDMKYFLKQDMTQARAHLQKHASVNFARKFGYVILGMFLAVVIIIGIDILYKGGIQNTIIYQLFEEEPMEDSDGEGGSRTVEAGEHLEPETNRKNQIIITVPETEPVTEPGPIPDMIVIQTGE